MLTSPAVQTSRLIPTGFMALMLLASSCSRSSNSNSVSGTIEVDEARVASRYGGRVQKTLAQEGDGFSGGQVIVGLDAAGLPAHRDRIAAQLAQTLAGPRQGEIGAA